MAKDNTSSSPSPNPPRKSHHYAVIIFVVLIFLLILLGISYMGLSMATITLIPSNSKIEHNFDLVIAEDPTTNTSTDVIIGKIFVEESDVSQQFFLDSDKEVEGIAEGEVILHNNQVEDQTLVANTRLLSPDDVLFRLKEQVDIPAGSSIHAKVYADQKGAVGDIGSTAFTIPGLSSSLQKLVYAESENSMSGGIRKIGVLTASDVEKAEGELEDFISGDILNKFIDNLDNKELTTIGTKVQISELSNNQELGEEVDSFTLSGKVLMQAVFAGSQKILDIANKKIKEANSSQAGLINIVSSSLQYELLEIDEDGKEAKVKIAMQGFLTIDSEKEIFDKNVLVGFTEEDLKLYFSQFESVKDVQVNFFPFWVKKVPIFKNRIIIQIEE